jgi:hypothetical protein
MKFFIFTLKKSSVDCYDLVESRFGDLLYILLFIIKNVVLFYNFYILILTYFILIFDRTQFHITFNSGVNSFADFECDI